MRLTRETVSSMASNLREYAGIVADIFGVFNKIVDERESAAVHRRAEQDLISKQIAFQQETVENYRSVANDIKRRIAQESQEQASLLARVRWARVRKYMLERKRMRRAEVCACVDMHSVVSVLTCKLCC